MGFRRPVVIALTGALILLCSQQAIAAVCVNRFLARSEGPRQVITLLTGKVTFQEAQSLDHASVQWVDEKGGRIAEAIELKVVRPMPVGCDGKTSGVVMLATFLSVHPPQKKMFVKLAGNLVEFEEQQ